VDALADLGFNRISLGVQDLTPEVQRAVNRVQSLEETARLVEHARRRGFHGINIDLIYGLPLQTPESFERTVDAVISLGVDRAAVYSFAFVPWVRGNQKKLDEDDLPSAETKVALFALARERFLRAGYEAIGMDHFARPDDELARARHEGRLRRNFQGYSVIPGDDVLGLGISAIGDVRGAYVQNEKKLSTYEEAVSAGVLPVARGIARTADDDVRRKVIHELMCNFRVDIGAIEREYGIDFHAYFAGDLSELEVHEREGMARLTDTAIEATAVGELFVRNHAMCFDRYQRERHANAERPVFSRTV
jgi:oxygen-independent coproporphyrinogen-3 oxidase